MANMPFDDINKLNLPFVDAHEIIGNVRVLRFKGSIDSKTLPQIIKLKKAIEQKGDINTINVLLDLKKVTYGDSAALGALILRLSELKRHNKKLGLINAPDGLINMLDIFKCRELFSIYESEEDALKSLG
ncbi:STAS domain-containing protein [Candidatus Omnitrophota bacterium]